MPESADACTRNVRPPSFHNATELLIAFEKTTLPDTTLQQKEYKAASSASLLALICVKKRKIQAQGGRMERRCVFTPAGADEHPLARDWVGYGAVVVDEGRVKGHAVHVEGH